MALQRKRNTTPVLVESRSERETQIAPDGKSGSTTTTTTTVREGPAAAMQAEYAAAITATPTIGQTLSARLSPTEAGQARLELVTKLTEPWQINPGDPAPDPDNPDPDPEPEPEPEAPPDPITEIEWAELRRALESHPRYASISADAVAKAKKYVEDPAANPAPTGLALELAEKLLRGQTEYSIAVPVVRYTSYHAIIPGTSAYTRGSPPYSPAGTWEWLKTADRVTQQGKWATRSQEWTGAKEWDPDIYT